LPPPLVQLQLRLYIEMGDENLIIIDWKICHGAIVVGNVVAYVYAKFGDDRL